MISLADLHDAIFVGLELKWEEGCLDLMFVPCDDNEEEYPIKISAHRFKSLVCPRNYPWGRSFYVSSIQLQRQPKDVTLTIEMQSGDEIQVKAEEVVLPNSLTG